MKKFFLFFVSILFISISSCKEDDPVYPKITGTWKPVKLVETTITNSNSVSDTYIYTTCQQESRWIFKDNNTGSVWLRDDTYTICHTKFESNLTYTYNEKTGEITINFLTGQEKGKVSDITDTTMNLKIETLDEDTDVYNSKVYTLVKVQ